MTRELATALVFGSSGQDAFYLGELCTRRGMTVVGSSRSGGDAPGDVGDFAAVETLVRQVRPTAVFHLAATSTAAHDALFDHHRTIGGGTWNICEAVRRHCPEARVFIAGSGLQFENDGTPIDARRAFAPTSPYAVARIQAALTARYYRSLGFRVYVGYLFHHDSARRGPGHLSMKIAQAAAEIAAGSRQTLRIGDPTVEKEWGFAGDIAAGMLALLDSDAVFEAAIGTGIAHPVARWLELCFAQVGLDWRDHVTPIEDYRPDFRRLVSDPATMHGLGWQASVPIEELCGQMMQAVS